MATHVLIRTQDKLSDILNANSDFTSSLSGTWTLVDTDNSEIERVGNSLVVTDNSLSDTAATFKTAGTIIQANTSTRKYVYQVKYKINSADPGSFSYEKNQGGVDEALPLVVGVEQEVEVNFAAQAGTYSLSFTWLADSEGGKIEFDYIEVREIESKGTGNFIISIEDTITSFYNSELHTYHPTNGEEGIFDTATANDNVLYDTPGAIIINNSPGIHTENVLVFFDADGTQVMTNALMLEIAKASKSKSAVVDITDKLPKIVKHIELS